MTDFIAHVRGNGDGKWRVHDLSAHLKSTARRSMNFAQKFGAGALGYKVGLWHDLGKFKPEFQAKIRLKSGYDPEAHIEGINRVEHAITGALYSSRLYPQKITENLTLGQLICIPVLAHHAGLRNFQEDVLPRIKNSTEEINSLDKILNIIPLNIIPKEYLDQTDLESLKPTKVFDNKAICIKMLYSCLVDADFLDTERFMDPDKSKSRGKRNQKEISNLDKKLDVFLENKQENCEKTEVNIERQKILEEVESKAQLQPGFFSLTVPTGGGKTLTSLSFALKHALAHSKDRIIYAIPYTSIIEQTADVFREAVGAVLEHHSSLTPDKETAENRLLSENWAAPLIVTTNVQLFESLFHRKSSRNRKLHNIVNSVIILDEAQMLPPDYLTPILEVLKTLVKEYGVTVVFCSATQPAFQSKKTMNFDFKGIDDIRELISDVPALFKKFKRVTVQLPENFSYLAKPDEIETEKIWKDIAEQISEHEQVLSIVNTKKDARTLHDLLPEGCIHLSGNMCAQHRSAIITQIKETLKSGKPIRVVSTQLVEAGVDIDFPVVYRAMAGLDSIAQAAGRCNREGKLNTTGKVIVFLPPKKCPLGHLRQSEEAARAVLSEQKDPMSPTTYNEYYQNLLWKKGDTLDREVILTEMELLNFENMHNKFKIIDQLGKSVVVPYGDAKDKIKALEKNSFIDRDLLRSLQRFTVNIPEKIFKMLEAEESIKTYFDTISVLTNEKYYNKIFGFHADSLGVYGSDELIL